jgi:type VI secretion system protein ImpK
MRRPENLALLYQEVLTAVVRLRANRQGVTDANAFRHHTREALKTAASQALGAGYAQDDVRLATFATVAFLDESVLNSQNPHFADWLRQPLQEELFGTHIAGEVFFHNLEQLLGRTDSQDLADLLEVHYLCLLLGFGGRYSAGNRGELAQVMNLTGDKIRRIRGHFGPLSPAWAPPPGAGRSGKDPWARKLAIAAIACAALMILLFVVYKLVLSSGAQISGAGFRPNATHFSKTSESAGNGGADPLVRAGPPGPALLSKNQVIAVLEKPARGPAADQGVRPTMPAWQAGSLLYGGRRA